MSSHSDLIPNFSFKVTFDMLSFSFTKISNISGSVEIDTIINGGHNDSPVILRKPKKNPDMLVLEKGTRTSLSDMAFSFFKEGRKIDMITITVKRNGKTVRMFSIIGGVIVRREYAPLDAMGNSVFLESLQIAHTGITEIALPMESFF